MADALRRGVSHDELSRRSHIDRWFLKRLASHLELERVLIGRAPGHLAREEWQLLKRKGWTDRTIATLMNVTEEKVSAARLKAGTEHAFLSVDT